MRHRLWDAGARPCPSAASFRCGAGVADGVVFEALSIAALGAISGLTLARLWCGGV